MRTEEQKRYNTDAFQFHEGFDAFDVLIVCGFIIYNVVTGDTFGEIIFTAFLQWVMLWLMAERACPFINRKLRERYDRKHGVS